MATNRAPSVRELPIAVRGYVQTKPPGKGGRPGISPSDWVLVFDTETTTRPDQRLRVGYFQVRKVSDPSYCKAGLFIDPSALSRDEVRNVFRYASNRLSVLDLESFVEEIFFKYTYDFVGRCVGMNLPFDISRLAYQHWPCTQDPYRGGFSFRLSGYPTWPTVQIKHLNNLCSFIRFTIPQGRSPELRAREKLPNAQGYRGAFIDVRTLAAGLTGASHSLKSLALLLQTPHQKTEVDDYGAPINEEFLEYVENDVQVTWECYERLQAQYDSFKLTETPSHKIFGEASIGKAYLAQMGIGHWRRLQPDFPPELLGSIMSTYYGGRSEVRLRRTITRVLYCDFMSMYPTVCSLMNLWRFVTAKGVHWHDATEDVRSMLTTLTLDQIQDQKTWSALTTIVSVLPRGDLFPTRARYGDGDTFSIGLNHIECGQPVWYTLADCMASTLLTCKTPQVIEAIRFEPLDRQDGLKPVEIGGNADCHVDPNSTDFYRRLIELRQQFKQQMKRPDIDDADRRTLDALQQAAKITANATSYGIFVELNVAAPGDLQLVTCFGMNKEGFQTSVRATEQPGSYFHPLLATTITGAARLMLAIAETLGTRSGIGWALCDTDSFAFARPEKMGDEDFIKGTESIRHWFDPLVPYEGKHDLFKMEDENYPVGEQSSDLNASPLFCYAVSSKRYVLFDIDKRRTPIIRKLSAHGLGHLLAPTEDDLATPDIPSPKYDIEKSGVRRWQYDLWYLILQAALADSNEVDFGSITAFANKAVVRYAATTPRLLEWYEIYNKGLPYTDQVKPFNFLLMFHVSAHTWRTWRKTKDDHLLPPDIPSVVAPYERDPALAATKCFDRNTKRTVPSSILQSYAQALAQYHLHPESKFEHADFLDRGGTWRWQVEAPFVEYIGKEANRWEEQAYLGENPESQIIYGVDPEGVAAFVKMLAAAAKQAGYASRIAREANINRKTAASVIAGTNAKPELLAKLSSAHRALQAREQEHLAHINSILDAVRTKCQREGGREFARQHGLVWSNLNAVLNARRKPGPRLISSLERIVIMNINSTNSAFDENGTP